MQKLLVAFPMYRQLPVDWFINWLKMEKEYVIATIATDGAYLPLALAMMVEQATEQYPDWERMVIFEQDMIPPPNAFTRIAEYGDDYDIVGSIYFKHEYPYHVNVCMQVDGINMSPLTAEAVRLLKDNPALYEVDGVSTGFTSVNRKVFENWDPKVDMWMPKAPFVGHDMHFCHEAKKQGFKVWVDSGIGCGHLTMVPIGYPHSQDALALNEPLTWAQAYDVEEDPGIPDLNSGEQPTLTLMTSRPGTATYKQPDN